jgi:hypothetical protein
MKKILIVAAAAGLMSLAACGEGTTTNTTDNTAVEANASIYADGSENSANAEAENVLENTVVENTVAPANAN